MKAVQDRRPGLAAEEPGWWEREPSEEKVEAEENTFAEFSVRTN
jgi:hypothetical protein